MKVYNQYNRISAWFAEHRYTGLMEREYVETILKYLPPEGQILDLGCGTGKPLAEYFIERGHHVTGVDGSEEMIRRCTANFPMQLWIVADMLNIPLFGQFDVILAWHSFFHLTHNQQRQMFPIFSQYLKDGGVLAFTSGDKHGEVYGENGSENLYHASLSIQEYEDLLSQHGFKVIIHKVDDKDCGNATTWLVKKCQFLK